MLFARFIAENGLLIEPEMGGAITFDAREELAKDEDVDKWALAARFAHRTLPQVFRRKTKSSCLVDRLPVFFVI